MGTSDISSKHKNLKNPLTCEGLMLYMMIGQLCDLPDSRHQWFGVDLKICRGFKENRFVTIYLLRVTFSYQFHFSNLKLQVQFFVFSSFLRNTRLVLFNVTQTIEIHFE
jgi:hypothetical protein